MDFNQISSQVLNQIINITSVGSIFNFLVPFVIFTYAVKILFDQINIFSKAHFTHFLLGIIVSLAAFFILPSLNILFASLAIFIIFTFELHGMRGVVTGVVCGVVFFIAYPLLLRFFGI